MIKNKFDKFLTNMRKQFVAKLIKILYNNIIYLNHSFNKMIKNLINLLVFKLIYNND
jgi:hypothetical protein